MRVQRSMHVRLCRTVMKGHATPLLRLLQLMNDAEREQLAQMCFTSRGYLYHLATGERKRPAVQMAFAIEDATTEINALTRGRLPIVTAREISTMHALSGLTAR